MPDNHPHYRSCMTPGCAVGVYRAYLPARLACPSCGRIGAGPDPERLPVRLEVERRHDAEPDH